ncbi:hypothetical protein [Myxococcus qinghaiensis]|uniref:hypothetical protein n=1 Tax=Myxococcus qinghaiensis TaxID=2906758 RepID=UPI0020A71A4B|nr:hypothetical protein [Myxococcus qinghaiensis]MCP3161559.1 hypothetical protein [Myxococcus qinghaiensis]
MLTLFTGCTDKTKAEERSEPERQDKANPGGAAEDPEAELQRLEELPEAETKEVTNTFIQRTKSPTDLEENLAIHTRLPAPANDNLKDSLIRVMGTRESPVVLFRSDFLEEMGVIARSPGTDFFTSLSVFDEDRELSLRFENEEALAKGVFGETSEDTVVFEGLSPTKRIKGELFNKELFLQGDTVAGMLCSRTPRSSWAAWEKSLLITAEEVVADPFRTWNACTHWGTPGGAWTFAHLMRQMATNSSMSPEQFTLRWLETWLNEQVINGDKVAARTFIFSRVIEPWATASNASATLVTDATGRLRVLLSGALNLDMAPLSLRAIVNRTDMGRTTKGKSGYGGTTTAEPVDAGELRFVFAVQMGLGTTWCSETEFTVIIEYGVPINGCGPVVSWARSWLDLSSFTSFDENYLSALEKLTKRVVTANVAPKKGNKSALNQLRTNEVSLQPRYGGWELREFTLSIERPASNTDIPANGPLRPHTVAQSPDDDVYDANSSPEVDDYVRNVVLPTVPFGSGPAPGQCSSNYTVPYRYLGQDFRGGNSLVPPDFWRAVSINPWDSRELCARHDFSLNTCQGCHSKDTATDFTHVKPTGGIPAALSRFLTGGGPGWFLSVRDTQFPGSGYRWRFADLDRRWRRLNELALCTSCGKGAVFESKILEEIARVAGGVLPIDPVGPVEEEPPFKAGPIKDSETARAVFELRKNFVTDFRDETLDTIRPAESITH